MARSPRYSSDSRLAVAYIRVSTREQKLGPEAQKASIQAWATAHGVTIAEWFVDQGVSGSVPAEARPGLMGALAAIGRLRAGLLVVARRDRLARDRTIAPAVEARWLRPLGARLRSVAGEGTESAADDPDAVLAGGLHDLLAEHLRAVIRHRTRQALGVKRARGERIGCVPFGSRVAEDGRTLVPDDAEAAVVERIRELHGSGLSQRAIAGVLAADGVVSRAGKPLSQVQVCRVLARPAPPVTRTVERPVAEPRDSIPVCPA